MVDCCIGEIRLFAGAYAPQGWAPCNGSLLLIAQNHALFSVIGSVWVAMARRRSPCPICAAVCRSEAAKGPD